MRQQPVTTRTVQPDEVRGSFGDLSDLAVARIVATGATPADVLAAHAALFGEPRPGTMPASARPERVGAVAEIVQTEVEPPDEPGS